MGGALRQESIIGHLGIWMAAGQLLGCSESRAPAFESGFPLPSGSATTPTSAAPPPTAPPAATPSTGLPSAVPSATAPPPTPSAETAAVPTGVCGDGVLNQDMELCDTEQFGLHTCESSGFTTGSLGCREDCTLDLSGCEGVETCDDGKDNDGDGEVDCRDADCSSECQHSCSGTTAAREHWVLNWEGVGRIESSLEAFPQEAPACSSEAGSQGHIFSVVADKDGVVSARLSEGTGLGLRAQGPCPSTSGDEHDACTPSGSWLTVPAAAGEELFVTVAPTSTEHAEQYVLEIHPRELLCGDGHRDLQESCDDGNTTSGDGCDSQCNLEASEQEPNNTLAEASAWSNPYFGAVGEDADVDYVALPLLGGASYLRLDVASMTMNGCRDGLMDSLLRVLDASGNLVGQDDDGGLGYCSSVVLRALAPGDYRAEVSGVAGFSDSSFSYQLSLQSSLCGDGVMEIGEACDDGNEASGDGCSSACQLEVP